MGKYVFYLVVLALPLSCRLTQLSVGKHLTTDEIIISVFCLAVLMKLSAGGRRPRLPRVTTPIALFTAVTWASIMVGELLLADHWSPSVKIRFLLAGKVWLEYVPLIILGGTLLSGPRDAAFVVKLLAIWAALLGVYGICQYNVMAGGAEMPDWLRGWDYKVMMDRGPRAISSFGAPSSFGRYMMIGLLCGTCWLLFEKKGGPLNRLVVMGVLVGCYGGLLVSMSRAPFLGLLAALLVVLVPRTRGRARAGLIFLLVMALVVIPAFYRARLAAAVQPLVEEGQFGPGLATRWSMWASAVRATLRGNVVLGNGLTRTNILDNDFVYVFYYYGLLGLAAFIWIPVEIWKELAKGRARSRAGGALMASTAAHGALVGMLFSALLGRTFFSPRVISAFWLLCAAALRAYQLESEAAEARLPEASPEEMMSASLPEAGVGSGP